jgi:hypothetical protein
MKPDHFANAPADAVANHCASERPLDAEPEAAHRQIVGLRENGEVGIGAALPIAVNRVEFRLAYELACFGGAARDLLPVFTRA